MVGSSIKEALDVVHLQRAIPGTVLAVNGSLCVVQMDDGGVPTSSTPGQVECILMNGVADGSRVRDISLSRNGLRGSTRPICPIWPMTSTTLDSFVSIVSTIASSFCRVSLSDWFLDLVSCLF
jgi:hypothetical protein